MNQCHLFKKVMNKCIHLEQSSDHFFSWSDDLIIRTRSQTSYRSLQRTQKSGLTTAKIGISFS